MYDVEKCPNPNGEHGICYPFDRYGDRNGCAAIQCPLLTDELYKSNDDPLPGLTEMLKIKVVTICGSMRFMKTMMRLACELELKHGYAVIQCVYDPVINSHKDIDTLDRIHRKKIEISDAIFVVNVTGLIGNSTMSEIEYAKSLGKEIIYYEKNGE